MSRKSYLAHAIATMAAMPGAENCRYPFDVFNKADNKRVLAAWRFWRENRLNPELETYLLTHCTTDDLNFTKRMLTRYIKK